MPRTILRLLAVLLLAMAVPAQGMAAVVAAQCMVFGHHQDGGNDGHVHDGTDEDHGAHSHSSDTNAGHDEGGASSHCGPCTACCASASISGFNGLALPPAAANPLYFFSQLPPPGVQPHGLDRPPLAL